MSDADSNYENHVPDNAPPDAALNDPYRFITWLRTIDARHRFQYEDVLTSLIRARPASERDFLLHQIKDMGFGVMTMREKLKQLGKMEDTKFRATATYVTKDYLAEMIYRPDMEPKFGFLTHFFERPDASPDFVEKIKEGDEEIHPLASPLVRQRVIMLPSQYEEYGTDKELFAELHALITKYVVVDEVFSKLATAWTMYSWVADRFSVCVYL